MSDRTLKLRDLRRILRRFGVAEDVSRGKGSHTYFWKVFSNGKVGYPLPTQVDVNRNYIRSCRKKFRLTEEDGVSDEEFYRD